MNAWIVREQNGHVWLFMSKPIKGKFCWQMGDGILGAIRLDDGSYPQVQWEDKEPTRVEITIKILED